MSGLFVDLPSTPPGYLPELARHIASHDPNINQLAITGINPWQWYEIDTMAFPGTIFAGAHWAPWWGPRWDTPKDLATSPSTSWMLPVAGAAGMLTPSYRWNQIDLDTEVIKEAAQRGLDFYVSQEIGIDAMGDHPRLRQAWEAYFVEICKRVQQYGSSNMKTLWSPYAWDEWKTVSGFRQTRIATALRTLVTNVRAFSGTRGITFIDLQDGQGVQPHEPATDATNWYNLVRDCGTTVRVNAEWFKQDNSPQDAKVMKVRLDYYAQHNVPIGCCWEAKDWFVPYHANHL